MFQPSLETLRDKMKILKAHLQDLPYHILDYQFYSSENGTGVPVTTTSPIPYPYLTLGAKMKKSKALLRICKTESIRS